MSVEEFAFLTVKGFVNLPRNAINHDFTFIVGSECYECPLLIACFLSPRLCSFVEIDPTIRDFVIETSDPTGYFQQFLSLGWGFTIPVSSENRSLFLRFLGELENHELFENYIGKDININNVFDRLDFLLGSNSLCVAEIEFCSSHFF
jgi:hypothetical protein